MRDCARKLLERFDRKVKDGLHARLDAVKENTVRAFLDLELLKGRVRAVAKGVDLRF